MHSLQLAALNCGCFFLEELNVGLGVVRRDFCPKKLNVNGLSRRKNKILKSLAWIPCTDTHDAV